MTRSAEHPQDVPAIGISIQHQLDQERNLVFQCHVGADESDAAIDKLVDRLFRASNRQAAVLGLPAAIKALDRLKTMEKRMAEDVVRLDAEAQEAQRLAEERYRNEGRKGPMKPSPAQINARQKNEADRTNAMTTISRVKEDIKAAEEQVAKFKAQIGEPAEKGD